MTQWIKLKGSDEPIAPAWWNESLALWDTNDGYYEPSKVAEHGFVFYLTAIEANALKQLWRFAMLALDNEAQLAQSLGMDQGGVDQLRGKIFNGRE